MIKVPVEDRLIGLNVYGTETKPIPGRIKERLEDFIVEERLKTTFLNNLRSKPSDNYRFPVVRILKRKIDSLTAISNLASQLGVSISKLRFLGLKDSRARAAQHVSILIRKLPLKKRENVLGWGNRPIIRRDLVGNFFRITVRIYKSIRELGGILRNFLEEVEGGKVPNFYGYQRFGSPRGINHLVGKKILLERYKDAVLTYLTDGWMFEEDCVKNWRRLLLETMNFKEAYKNIPRRLIYEKKILSRLIDDEDYEKAFKTIPISLRRLFINAYQSYLFNKTLSLRIEKGYPINSLLKGDLASSIETEEIKILNEIKADKWRYIPVAQLIGYGYREMRGVQSELEMEVLKEEELSPKMFYVKKMPEISCKGGFRQLQIPFLHFCLTTDSGKLVTLIFTLSTGGYATILLRELIKPKHPYLSGF